MGTVTGGLYQKYRVERLNDPDSKHVDCLYFVLDPRHDSFARDALAAYIEACQDKYPALAFDLRGLLGAAIEYAESSRTIG